MRKLVRFRKLTALIIVVLTIGIALPGVNGQGKGPNKTKFHFTVVSDSHMHHGCRSFSTFTCPAILANPDGPGAFMINTGDFDVFNRINKAITEKIINPLKAKGKDYHWYPVVGNHDLYNTSNDSKFRTEVPEDTQTRQIIKYNKKNLQNIVNWGPAFKSKLPGYENNGSKYTTYSFDYGNCHFVVLDLFYANGIGPRGCGNFHTATQKWLENDLKNNKKKHVFIFGHHPAISYKTPKGELINKWHMNFRRKQFWDILKKYKVDAYFCGHTHRFGITLKDGVTQICSGASGTKSKASYEMFFVDGDKVTYKAFFYKSKTWKELSGTIK